jgi:hypothetical protein
MFGTAERPGRGLPDRLLDDTRLRPDLMPYAERTLQRRGIVIDEICYYDDVLRPWIGASDHTTGCGRWRRRPFRVPNERSAPPRNAASTLLTTAPVHADRMDDAIHLSRRALGKVMRKHYSILNREVSPQPRTRVF